MGSRKKQMAEKLREQRRSEYRAQLRNCSIAPRKMRLVADMVRGMEVGKASAVLRFTKKHAAQDLEKLLRSAISNFEQKTGERWEDSDLYIKEIWVDGGRVLKRIQPAPQGRAHRIRKRSNHVTMILDSSTKQFETIDHPHQEVEQQETEA